VALNNLFAANGSLADHLLVQQYTRVELEIGSARGDLLCELAEWHPHCLYVGVEIDPAFCEEATSLVRARHLGNVAIVNDEALHFLSAEIPSHLLDTIHIYHPTPRREGNFRRLITPDFERQSLRTLRTWGTLRLLTDDHEYYTSSVRLFTAERWWAVEWQRDEFALRHDAYAGSPLEMQYRAAGEELYAVQLAALPSRDT
jgi:tRNA G46 methylase TrmB